MPYGYNVTDELLKFDNSEIIQASVTIEQYCHRW